MFILKVYRATLTMLEDIATSNRTYSYIQYFLFCTIKNICIVY